MNPTSSPQADPKAQPPTANVVNPVVQPVVQEAPATVTVPKSGSSSNTSKIVVGLLFLILLVAMGALGYNLLLQSSNKTNVPTSMTSPAPTKIMVSPTPKNEVEAVDQIDTSFPDAEVKGIQTDLQGL